MTRRVLFVASLHHPATLLRELDAAPPEGPPPLFPTSMNQHYWERAMRRRGYELEVFWRNLPGFGPADMRRLRDEHYTERITPGRVLKAIGHRLPPELNPDIRQRNQRLIAQARAFQPDWLWLIGDNRVITAETLATIKRKTGCTLIYVSGVSPIVFSLPVERRAARLYDLVLVNDYYHGVQWLELGSRHMEALPIAAIDPDIHQPYALSDAERAAYACDVGFVGTLVPANLYSERVAALEALRDFDLGVWSTHDIPASLRPFRRGSALGLEMMRVLSAVRIAPNVHGDFMRYGGNMRLFEAAALGAFQIVDDRPGVRRWFTEGEHLAIFRDHADLRDKVRYYLRHEAERQQMAEAARQHVRQHHTYEQRLSRVEDWLNDLAAS